MYPCAKLKLDQLFLQWLSLPDSQQLVSLLFPTSLNQAMPKHQHKVANSRLGLMQFHDAAQVSNLVEDAKQGKALKGPSSNTFNTPLSPTTSHAIFASTVSSLLRVHTQSRLCKPSVLHGLCCYVVATSIGSNWPAVMSNCSCSHLCRPRSAAVPAVQCHQHAGIQRAAH